MDVDIVCGGGSGGGVGSRWVGGGGVGTRYAIKAVVERISTSLLGDGFYFERNDNNLQVLLSWG